MFRCNHHKCLQIQRMTCPTTISSMVIWNNFEIVFVWKDLLINNFVLTVLVCIRYIFHFLLWISFFSIYKPIICFSYLCIGICLLYTANFLHVKIKDAFYRIQRKCAIRIASSSSFFEFTFVLGEMLLSLSLLLDLLTYNLNTFLFVTLAINVKKRSTHFYFR